MRAIRPKFSTIDRLRAAVEWFAPVIASPTKTNCQVVGVVLLRQDGAALLQHRDDIATISDPGLWVFPGGHLEWDELAVDGAVREMEEETGYRCHNPRSLTSFPVRDGELCFFWDHYDDRQEITCREGQALEFVNRAQLPAKPTPAYLPVVFDLALAVSKLSQVEGSRPTPAAIP